MEIIGLLLAGALAIAIGLSCNPSCLTCAAYCITCNPSPRVFEVTFAGVVQGTAFCADCAATWNTTFILPIHSGSPPVEARCDYRYPDISVIGFVWCGAPFPSVGGAVILNVFYTAGTNTTLIRITVSNDLTPLAVYEQTFAGKLDCDATVNEDIPIVSFEDGTFGARCNWAASTCSITIA